MRVALVRYIGETPGVIRDEKVCSLLLESENGEPLVLFYELQPGVVLMSKHGDEDFEDCLSRYSLTTRDRFDGENRG